MINQFDFPHSFVYIIIYAVLKKIARNIMSYTSIG